MKHSLLFALMLAGAASSRAQSPLISELQQSYGQIKGALTAAAEKVSEADYSFKPTPQVRSYGEEVIHGADVQMLICATAKGEKNSIDKSKSDKASAVAQLKATFDYCDPIYASLTDASLSQIVKMFGRDRTTYGTLNFAIIHDNETYGTMVVYMRLKGIVPPTSEPRPGAGKK